MTASAATTFHLKDPATGAMIGPVELREGAPVVIGGKTYAVAKVDTGEAELAKRLKAVMLPSVDFRNAALADCMAYLQQSIASRASKGQEVNLLLRVEGEAGSQPAVTISMRNVSAYDILKFIAELTGARMTFEGNTVTLLVKGGPGVRPPSPADEDPFKAFFEPIDVKPDSRSSGAVRPKKSDATK